MGENGWIAVDLDGTLAKYDSWRGADHIGDPIAPMVERVRQWISQGIEVRIFTARVSCPDPAAAAANVKAWARRHIGVELPVTNVKDYAMIECWDDRAVQVIPNTGMRADGQD